MNTLLFQNIPQQTTITTHSAPPGGGIYVARPWNAGGWQQTHIYQVGRDGHTIGNPAGDKPEGVYMPYPICPYHMPTNSNRYNDPSLHVPYKKVKDLIELKDINSLIERITLFTYLWNAEADDILYYETTSKIRSKVLSNLKPIGTTFEAEVARLVYDIYTKHDLHKYQIDNSGYHYWEQQVNSGVVSLADLEATIVRVAEVVKLVYDAYEKYDFHQYQRDKLGYNYWVDQINSGALSAANVEATILAAGEITSFVHGIYTKYDLHQYQTDNSGYEFWIEAVKNGTVSMLDAERMILRTAGGVAKRIPSNHFYFTPSATVVTHGRNTFRRNSPYIRIVDLSQTEYNSLNSSLFAPTSFLNNNQKMKDVLVGENSAITLPDTRKGKIQSSGNPVIFHCGQERLFRVTTYLEGNQNLVLAYHDEEKIAPNSYNKNTQENTHFENRKIGNIIINNQRYFVITYRTNDKTALKPELRYIVMKLWFYDNVSKIFNVAPITEVRESDWSVQEQFRTKRGKHPIIMARDFVLIQQTLDRLINALTDLSGIALSGVTDDITKTNINNFKMSHIPNQTSFDKDNPDTNFYNYQAQPQAIIKVGFYNTLVDAYKLLINSCMCNCDCACNSNCVCNTNCGCNYG